MAHAGSSVERREDPRLSPCESQLFTSESRSRNWQGVGCRDGGRRARTKQWAVAEAEDATLKKDKSIFQIP